MRRIVRSWPTSQRVTSIGGDTGPPRNGHPKRLAELAHVDIEIGSNILDHLVNRGLLPGLQRSKPVPRATLNGSSITGRRCFLADFSSITSKSS